MLESMSAHHLVVFRLWLTDKVWNPIIAVDNVFDLIFQSKNTQDTQGMLGVR